MTLATPHRDAPLPDAPLPDAPLPDAPLPDAGPDNWVDRFAPTRLRPWLKLGRLDRPAGAWLLLLPGWQGIALADAMARRPPSLDLMLLFLVGAFVMRAAGCAFNDIVDKDFDRQVARTAARPIAAGQISRKGALGFVVGCCLVGLVILTRMNLFSIGLGAASLVLVAIYPFMKRITWWPQAWLGLTFNWGALLGFAAVEGRLGPPCLLLYLGGVFWTLGYDTIYALQDIEDDALVGVKSSARRLGGRVRVGVTIFYGLAAALALASVLTAGLGALSLIAVGLYAGHLFWQAGRVRAEDGALALRLFKSNRWAGFILFSGLAAGALRI
jgi:4-hydroxybenzoate polyprenyltransferase